MFEVMDWIDASLTKFFPTDDDEISLITDCILD